MPTLLQGLQSALGGFGRGIISGLQNIGQGIASAFRLAEVAQIEVDVPTVTREWGQIKTAGEREGQFNLLGDDHAVPHAWYGEAGPWQRRRYGYEYEVYGRDIATGRFTRRHLSLSSSRELLPGEVKEYAHQAVGREGESPMVEIFSIGLVGATHREGETW